MGSGSECWTSTLAPCTGPRQYLGVALRFTDIFGHDFGMQTWCEEEHHDSSNNNNNTYNSRHHHHHDHDVSKSMCRFHIQHDPTCIVRFIYIYIYSLSLSLCLSLSLSILMILNLLKQIHSWYTEMGATLLKPSPFRPCSRWTEHCYTHVMQLF